MKKCIRCDEQLNDTNWASYSKANYINKCMTCLRVEKTSQAKIYRINPENRATQSERSKKYQRELRKSNPKRYTARQMHGSAKKRANKKGLDCNIDSQFIESIATNKCPIFGFELIYGGSNKGKQGASLDRIDSSKGYIKGNVWIISNLANMMKSNATIDELLSFGDWCDSLRIKLSNISS